MVVKRYMPKIVERKKTKPKDSFNGKPTAAPLRKTLPLTKAELWASYGLNRPAKPRYEGLKGIYWYVLSIFVRTRDLKLFHRCISCNKWVNDISELQAGHFIAAGTGGFNLLFDLRNVNGECGYCNGFDQNHLVGYERGLDERYGAGAAEILKGEYYEGRKVGAPVQKEWSKAEYDQRIRDLQAAIISLE